jgi:hypothetical protein
MHKLETKKKAQSLRSKGKSYNEIRKILNISVSKSTLSGWCNGIELPMHYKEALRCRNALHLSRIRDLSARNQKERRQSVLLQTLRDHKEFLDLYQTDKQVKKIGLVILYLAEGSKSARGSLMFGNSDPAIIQMFLDLMRECYKLDESKFRCTVQCRADQNIPELEQFWSQLTSVPLSQFYGARVDKRTVGQVSRKPNYKGVCRVDYFSSAIDLELKCLARALLGDKF